MSTHPQPPTQAAPPTSPSALRQWITRHPILAYLLLAYIVGWAIWLVPLLSREGLGVFPYDAPPVQVFALLASVIALTGSAFTVTALVDGRPGVRALARRYFRWRVGVQWYLLAVFGLLVVGLIAQGLFHGPASLGTLPHQGSALISYLVGVVVGAVVVHLWEDGGWAGFMLTRLQPRFGALVASLLVAPSLGGIHLPLLFITGGVTPGRVPPSQLPLDILLLLVLTSVPVWVIGGWLYNNARASVLIVALFHSSFDVAGASSLLPKLTYAEFLGAMAVVALLVVLLTRGRLAYKPIPELQPVPPA